MVVDVRASRAPSTTGTGRPPIHALTGLRAVAAGWVVLFHIRDDVLTLAPALHPLEPVLAAGYLGVDVFFVLSGFVLAYTYGERLRRPGVREVRGFLQNRVARVWPAHVVTLHLDLLQAAVIGTLGVTDGGHRRTVSAYVQNLTMTQTWWNDRPSFNGPSWSISAEWAAYLLCPLLLLLLARVGRARAALVAAGSAYALMLVVLALWAGPDGNVPHAGMLRVAAEFVAGVLLLRVHQHRPAWLGRLTLPLALAVVVALLLVPAMRPHYWVAPALGLLVLLVACDTGPLGRLLATRPLVAAGEASYSLYLTHWLMTPALHAVVEPRAVAGSPWALRLLVLAGYAVALAVAAVALRRLVEVPGRRLLRAR